MWKTISAAGLICVCLTTDAQAQDVMPVMEASETASTTRTGIAFPAAIFAGAEFADWHSTYLARARGLGVEQNPVMAVGPGGQAAIKIATTVSVVYLLDRLSARRPMLAKTLLWTASAVTVSVAARNYRIASQP